jgi:outer membrane usher protein
MQLAHHDRGADVRLLVSGAAVAVGGQATATRQINGGFAIVETPGVPGVQIYAENRPVARTDRNGRAVITDLRPYEVNRITLNPADLPIQARLGAAGVEVVPARLGAVRARFSVVLEHPATLVLTDAAGVELEAGAPARIDGGEALRVGYDGELFTPTLRAGAEVVVQRPSGPCRARVSTLPPDGGVPRIGPLVCQPMEAAS